MKEQQIHAGLMLWLKKNGLFYIHSTFGKKATMTKDAPDFIILHCNRALLVECKTQKGGLTAGQKAQFEKLRERSGMVVQIARSVEEAVAAVETWQGVVRDDGGQPGRGELPPVPECPKSDEAAGASFPKQFIGSIGGKDYVLSGDPSPGGSAAMVRMATAADLINIQRR